MSATGGRFTGTPYTADTAPIAGLPTIQGFTRLSQSPRSASTLGLVSDLTQEQWNLLGANGFVNSTGAGPILAPVANDRLIHRCHLAAQCLPDNVAFPANKLAPFGTFRFTFVRIDPGIDVTKLPADIFNPRGVSNLVPGQFTSRLWRCDPDNWALADNDNPREPYLVEAGQSVWCLINYRLVGRPGVVYEIWNLTTTAWVEYEDI